MKKQEFPPPATAVKVRCPYINHANVLQCKYLGVGATYAAAADAVQEHLAAADRGEIGR